MSFYGDIPECDRIKIQALQDEFFQKMEDLLPDLSSGISASRLQQLIFQDMGSPTPTLKRKTNYYTQYLAIEGKQSGGIIAASQRYKALSSEEKDEWKEQFNDVADVFEDDTEVTYTTFSRVSIDAHTEERKTFLKYSNKLKKLSEKMYAEANYHVLSYLVKRPSTDDNPLIRYGCTVFGTELAQKFGLIMNRETGFETFVNKHDVGKVINNRGKRVRLGGPTQERTERQKLQSSERSIFTSLVLNSLKNAISDPVLLQNLTKVPWNKLETTRAYEGITLQGWPSIMPVSPKTTSKNIKHLSDLLNRGEIKFVPTPQQE